MKLYQINYDLRNPRRNYDELYRRIRSYGTYAHILDSCWLIQSSGTAMDICTNLKQAMDANDGLIVAEMTRNSAWFGLNADTQDWMRSVVQRAA